MRHYTTVHSQNSIDHSTRRWYFYTAIWNSLSCSLFNDRIVRFIAVTFRLRSDDVLVKRFGKQVQII